MKHPWFQALLCALILAVGALLVTLLVASRPDVEEAPIEPRIPLVQVTVVQLAPTTLTVASQGTVAAAHEAIVSAEVGGRVEAVAKRLEPGGLVAAGEVLVTLDRRDLELALIGARAGVAEAGALLDREQAEADTARRDLEAAGVDEPSALARREPQLALATARAESAQAALDKAGLDLERATVRAPFDGLVLARLVEAGQVVAPGTPLARLAATDRFEVSLPLGRADLERLDPLGVGAIDGPTVALTATLGGRVTRFNGRIERTAPALDPRSRALGAVASIEDPLGDVEPLRLGTFVEAHVRGRVVDSAAVLPSVALRGPNEVWVVDGDARLHRRTVVVAQRLADRVVIEAGLAAGERVVVSALDLVVDGMRVVVEEAGPGVRD